MRTAGGRMAGSFLTSGNYVIEYEHLRLWKWAMVPAGSSAPPLGTRSLKSACAG